MDKPDAYPLMYVRQVFLRRAVAQLVAHRSPKPAVVGSSPACPADKADHCRRRVPMAKDKASDVESSRRDRTKSGATRKRGAVASQKAKKPGFFAGIFLFFKQVIDEMKKVTYPSGSETWTYFVVVVVFVAAIMLFAGLLDFGFGKLSALIFG